jgi:hypothetical protein
MIVALHYSLIATLLLLLEFTQTLYPFYVFSLNGLGRFCLLKTYTEEMQALALSRAEDLFFFAILSMYKVQKIFLYYFFI